MANLPKREDLLEEAYHILDNVTSSSGGIEYRVSQIKRANVLIYLANSLPAIPGGDRPFTEATSR